MLNWQINGSEAMACSSVHDDGSPFVYHFEKVGEVWRNSSDAELLHSPWLAEFRHLDTARMWAERNEKALGESLEKEYARERLLVSDDRPSHTAGENDA